MTIGYRTPAARSTLVLRASRLGFESFLVLIGYPLWLAALWLMGSAFGELMLRLKPIAWPPPRSYSPRSS